MTTKLVDTRTAYRPTQAETRERETRYIAALRLVRQIDADLEHSRRYLTKAGERLHDLGQVVQAILDNNLAGA